MKCPFCGHAQDAVVDSRSCKEYIRRRRRCLGCGRRYSTYEYIEDTLLEVTKRDGRHEPFDRIKLRESVRRACGKNSPAISAVEDMAAAIESQLREKSEERISSQRIGELVLEGLAKIDPKAYIRFGLGFHRLTTAPEMLRWLKQLESEQQMPVPASGRRASPRR